MSNHQQVTIVRDTAESNNEVDALAQAQAQQQRADTQETPDISQRPEWLPEKFKDPTELAKAYGELEKRLSGGAKPSDFSGLEKYSQEFAENGDLSAESIQAIVDMGLPEPMVRAYVEGQKAVQQTNVSTVMGIAGGEQQYQSMVDWAANTFDEAEIDAFNQIMDGGNMSSIRMAVQGLKARFEQANGSSGRLIQGEVAGPSGGAFRSVAEIVAAMKDPRYAKDSAYRKDVEQRVALSNALGVNK
jgi:hypothetical protein